MTPVGADPDPETYPFHMIRLTGDMTDEEFFRVLGFDPASSSTPRPIVAVLDMTGYKSGGAKRRQA